MSRRELEALLKVNEAKFKKMSKRNLKKNKDKKEKDQLKEKVRQISEIIARKDILLCKEKVTSLIFNGILFPQRRATVDCESGSAIFYKRKPWKILLEEEFSADFS